ncbi:uncharacterized protein LOC116295298, partial [Actinia tenebrosa]|uniref:Uncharacterized protein LOC116295298 n=1 Tax=Actinia tenebrosa TaxID=6105 RepID=A0A6P8HUJ1_ACTTE
IIDIDQPGPTVVQGLPTALTCPVFGYPEPFVAWVRDGVIHQNTTTTSVFKENELNENRNQSKWECIVSNIHGSDFHQFHITGVSWHRMCAKHHILATKRTLNDVISSPDQASNDTSVNESVWFRLQDPVTSQSMQIPESCTPSMHCSTQATGWLLGSHPGIQDGVVRRTVCFNWDGNCCKYNTTILVRRCHGFYVYKLQKSSFDVHAGYCA